MKNVADIYPLSPMQEVMLLHSAARPEGAFDPLFNQFSYEIEGALDLGAFRQAWQSVLDRHAVLRSVFLWKDLKAPVQVVRKQVELPVRTIDWTARSNEAQRADFEALSRDDRATGFDLERGPLTRVAIVQVAADRAWVIWSSHHLIVDRWCLSTIFRDLFAAYGEVCEARPAQLAAPGRFRDYIAWIQAQDEARAEHFWRETLDGFDRATPLVPTGTAVRSEDRSDSAAPVEVSVLGEPEFGSLRRFTRGQGCTMGTLLQGAWALVLNQWTGRQDVTFGTVVSGRPPQLPGVESIVGSFINNVPTRVRLEPGVEIGRWLHGIQDAQRARLAFEHVALTRVQSEWSSLTAGDALFDHLLVWLAPQEMPQVPRLTLRMLPGGLTTAYPMTLGIAETSTQLEFHVYRDRRAELDVPALLRCLHEALREIERAGAHATLDELATFRIDPKYRPTRTGPVLSPGTARVAAASANGSGTVPAPLDPVVSGREKAERELLMDLLRSEWQRLLGVEHIEADEDFFALGGTSLKAATLHGRIEAAVHVRVPLLALFQRPTLRAMADTLVEKDWPLTPRVVVPLQTRGEARPFFCVASPEVNTLGYSVLTRHLPDEQPVYVLQTPPTNHQPKRLHPSELLGLAERYLEALNTVQTEGPVHLLGMCSGAHIAFEMAKQLRAQDREVAFLGVINTWAFHTRSRWYRVEMARARLQHYAKRLRSMAALDPEARADALRALARRRAAARPDPGPRSGSAGATRSTEARSAAANPWLDEVGWARDDRDIQKFDGPITVFRVKKQQTGRIRSRSLGWEKHARSVQVEHLPAPDHDAILRHPHVRTLAERVDAYLAVSRDQAGA